MFATFKVCSMLECNSCLSVCVCVHMACVCIHVHVLDWMCVLYTLTWMYVHIHSMLLGGRTVPNEDPCQDDFMIDIATILVF